MISLPLSQSGLGAVAVAAQAAQEAGQLVVDYFPREKKEKLKGKSNLVTEADLLSEGIILSRLRAEFPEHRILSEESPAIVTSSAYTWVVDPLDGTNNYSFGIPFFCIAISLVKDRVLMGVVYDPLRRELFRAEEGGGAALNDKSISVSLRASLSSAAVACDLGYDQQRGQEMLSYAHDLLPRVHSVRILGSAALGLAYVAAGRLDAYLHRCLYPWDIAGGAILVQEAGGIVTDWQGEPLGFQSQDIIATNPGLRRELAELLKGRQI